jgi:hypothetical protein
MNRGLAHQKTVKQVEIQRRRDIVAVNLVAGATYSEIAATLNVSKATIAGDYKAILRAWKEHYADKLDKYLYLQLRRYDVMLNAVWERARNGDSSAIDRALAIMDRQNALMQIKKPGVDLQTGLIFNIYPTASGSALPLLSLSGGDETIDETGRMLNSSGLSPASSAVLSFSSE